MKLPGYSTNGYVFIISTLNSKAFLDQGEHYQSSYTLHAFKSLITDFLNFVCRINNALLLFAAGEEVQCQFHSSAWQAVHQDRVCLKNRLI